MDDETKQEVPVEAESKPQEAPVEGVPVEPAESMKVSWGPSDAAPVPTVHEVRLIRCYSNVDGRQLKVMKTADAEDCLHIFLDVV